MKKMRHASERIVREMPQTEASPTATLAPRGQESSALSLAPERFAYLLPKTFFAPSVVAIVDRLPRPELLLG